MAGTDAINKAYQSIFTALKGYSKDIGDSYRGGILELAQRISTTQVDKFGNPLPKGDFLSIIKDGEGELANWKTDTRIQMIRDIETVVGQFPELELAANTALEAMCDGDVVNGGMKFNITSTNKDLDAVAMVAKLEAKYQIRYHLRNTVYKSTLTHGEYYPMIKKVSDILNYAMDHKEQMRESVSMFESITQIIAAEKKSKSGKSVKSPTDERLHTLYESAEQILGDQADKAEAKAAVDDILKGIKFQSSFEQMMYEELGDEGLEIIAQEYGYQHRNSDNLFEGIIDGYEEFPETEKDKTKVFDKIKGCFVKWLNATQILPIKLGGTVLIGYYYIHYGNTNISNKTAFANGVIDLSQTTTLSSSRDFMQQLSNMIVSNLDLKFIQKNSDLIGEITSVLMENQFRKKDVSFTFISKEDIVPFKINIDTDGNGNSMFSKSIFYARLYTMMLMTNVITVLNNRPSRTYKVKRDPRTSNVAGTIQRFKEKIYSKRIGIDDVWSYNGAMNKIGSPNDMVIPVDPDGTPPFTKEYDGGAELQLNTDLMEMAKKNSISLSGVPNALINQQDEIEYSKLAQMAQLKLLDFVKNLKIDLNVSTTELYRRLFMVEFGLSYEDASAISVSIPDVRSNDINIISEMLQTFNTIFETLVTVLLTQEEAQTPEGKPSNAVKNLKYELMKMMVPSLDYVEIERIKKDILTRATADNLNDQRRAMADFSDEDIGEEDLNTVQQ